MVMHCSHLHWCPHSYSLSGGVLCEKASIDECYFDLTDAAQARFMMHYTPSILEQPELVAEVHLGENAPISSRRHACYAAPNSRQ
jgi:hypothetical protein